MRIDAMQKVAQLYSGSVTTKTSKKQVESERDKVQISQAGRDYQIARQAVKAVPDVREDLVAGIKSRVDAGVYDVSGDAFAEKVISKYNQMML